MQEGDHFKLPIERTLGGVQGQLQVGVGVGSPVGAGRQGRLAFVLSQPREDRNCPCSMRILWTHDGRISPDFYSTPGFELDQKEDGIRWAMHN